MLEIPTKQMTCQSIFKGSIDTVELFSGLEVFTLLSETTFQCSWDALYESCTWSTVFQSRPFVSTWYQYYQAEYLPIVVVAKHRQKLVALLTLACDNKGLIIGAGTNQAEYQVWLSSEAESEKFIKEALQEVCKHFPGVKVQLKYIPGNVPMGWISKHRIWKKRSFLQAYKHPFLIINNDLLADERRKKNRKEKFNRLKRLGEVKFERITNSNLFATVFDELAVQSDFRKGAMFNKAIFHSDPQRKKFLLSLFDQNILHATVLKLNDKIIASNVGAMGKNWLHMQGINSHTPFYAKYSPGILHFLLLDTLLVEEGVKVFDLTPGAESYKERLASDSSLAYQLCIDSVYNTAVSKIKSSFINIFKEYSSRFGLKPDALKKIKFSAYRNKEKILNGGKQGLISIIQHIFSSDSSTKKIRKYNLRPEVILQTSADSISIQENSLGDLLNFKQEKTGLMRWEFLADAMRRLEAEERCYTWSENGYLLGCAWHKPFGHSEVLLKDFYCHSSGLQRLPYFLAAVVSEVKGSCGVSPIYAVATEASHCRALEAAGLYPEAHQS